MDLNIRNHLFSLQEPVVMAILNATPDSFHAASRAQTAEEVVQAAERATKEGAEIIDIGGCSTRPGAKAPDEEEEWRRIDKAIGAIRTRMPEVLISVDTYRAGIVRRAMEKYGIDIVNDISGGEGDKDMFQTVAEYGLPYILTHTRGTSETMQSMTTYDHLQADIIQWLQARMERLHEMGVKDVIADPGFGFAKTTAQNWELLGTLRYLQVLGCPIAVGLSRKSMIQHATGRSAAEALNGTTAAHIIALQQGASILRVHDTREAKEAIRIYQLTRNL